MQLQKINFTLYSYKQLPAFMKHSQLKVTDEVFKLFNETQKLTTINKAIVFELVKIFHDKPKEFMYAFEQAFLKIFKSCNTKANKKIPNKFQNLAQAVFRQLLVFGDPQWESNNIMVKSVQFFNEFLNLNIEAISSSIMNIRIMGARNAFMIVKLIPQQFLSRVLKPEVQQNFATAIYQLLRLRVSTYRQLGAKLSSLVQTLKIPKIQLIQNQMFRIASLDDNEQIRKMVITNILISKNNVDKILIRLRDKNAEIRAIILRKLQTEKYLLDKNSFNLSQIYKILYDGFGSKQQSVKKQSINFYLISFGEDDYERKERKSMLGGYQKNLIKMEVQVQPRAELKSVNNPKFLKFAEFVEIFNPNVLMVNPHLCSLFDELIQKMIEQLPPELVSDYIRNLCHRLRYCSAHPAQFNNVQINKISMQIVWLKHCIKTNVRDVTLVFEGLCPTGLQLGKLLQTFIQRKNLYGSYELLRYFEKQAQQMPDQVSRNKMFDSLKKVLSSMNYFSAIYTASSQLNGTNSNLSSYAFYESPTNINPRILSQEDDICKIPTGKDLHTHKLMVSYYNLPIISSSLDLIHYIAIVMKILRPQHYQIEIKQTMAQWNDPQDRTLQKQRELVMTNINKMDPNFNEKKKYTDPMMLAFLERLRKVQTHIEENKEKTKIIILTIGKLNPHSDLEIYMPIIKGYLSRKNQAEGLLMLAYYCLTSIDRMQNFLLLFWKNISNHKIDFQKEPYAKDNILVSLRIFIDFIVKFDILKQNVTINDQIAKQFPGLTYNNEAFMQNFYQLLLHQDSQIRILTVESMCRLFYHEKIDTSYHTMSLTYLLLLWWSTDDEVTTAKCVHLISVFVKSYVDFNIKGVSNMGKFVEGLCIFFKLIMEQFKNGKTINKKNKIVYNLKLDEFIKRAIAVSVSILKAKPKKQYGKKHKKQTFEQLADNLKPQELFILFLLQEDGFQGLIDKALNNCDFIENASLQALILTKKLLEKMRDDGRVIKKNQSVISKFQVQVQDAIRNKNVSEVDEILLNGLQKELEVNCQMFTEELKKMIPKIQGHELFIQNEFEDVSDQSSVQQSSEQSQNSQQQQSRSFSQIPQVKRQQQSMSLRRKKKPAAVMDLSDEFDNQDDSSLIPKKRQTRRTALKRQVKRKATEQKDESDLSSSSQKKSQISRKQNVSKTKGKKHQSKENQQQQQIKMQQDALHRKPQTSQAKGSKQVEKKKKGGKKEANAQEDKQQKEQIDSVQNPQKKISAKPVITRNTRNNSKKKN